MAVADGPAPLLHDVAIGVGRLTLRGLADGPADRPLVMLLHGFPESALAWRKVMAALGDAMIHVVALDMRGCGLSDAPEGIAAYRLDRLVDDVVAVAEALTSEPFTLVGHDWGGIVAWAVAARHPARLSRLFIVNAPHPDTLRHAVRQYPLQALRSAYAAFFQIPRLPEAILRARRFALLRHSLRATARPGTFSDAELAEYTAIWAPPGRLSAMLNYYRALRAPRHPIGRITVPTTILWGMRDAFLGNHLAAAAAALCDQAEILRFRQASHWLPHEEPQRVAAAILHRGTGRVGAVPQQAAPIDSPGGADLDPPMRTDRTPCV